MLTFLKRIPSYVRIPFFVFLPMVCVFEYGVFHLAMNPTSLGAYLHHDAGNIQQSLIGYDKGNHMTLNGIPLGVPVEVALPACQGAPEATTVLCHGPLYKAAGDYLFADVRGFDAGKDRNGNPVVTSMTVYTTALNDMTIDHVNARIATTSALPTLVNTTEAIGTPMMRSYNTMKNIIWERDGHNVVMTQWLSTDNADLDLSTR